MTTINIAREYTPFPGFRLKQYGKGSGEEFRERFLVPIMEGGVPTVVELDGTSGYPSSFLEEAFGGLDRMGYPVADVRRLIKVHASRDFEQYARLIEEYLSAAAEEASH